VIVDVPEIARMRVNVRATVRSWLEETAPLSIGVLPYSSQDPDTERTTWLTGIMVEEFQHVGCTILGFSSQVFVGEDAGRPVALRRTTLLVQKPLIVRSGTAS
jgi:hypothetical protein